MRLAQARFRSLNMGLRICNQGIGAATFTQYCLGYSKDYRKLPIRLGFQPDCRICSMNYGAHSLIKRNRLQPIATSLDTLVIDWVKSIQSKQYHCNQFYNIAWNVSIWLVCRPLRHIPQGIVGPFQQLRSSNPLDRFNRWNRNWRPWCGMCASVIDAREQSLKQSCNIAWNIPRTITGKLFGHAFGGIAVLFQELRCWEETESISNHANSIGSCDHNRTAMANPIQSDCLQSSNVV